MSDVDFEREKWVFEVKIKEREIKIKENEQEIRVVENNRKLKEEKFSKWTNPLFLALVAAVVAALSNAYIALFNGRMQRLLEQEKFQAQQRLEETKSEALRILEVIKTDSPEKSLNNLHFLLQAGLITDSKIISRLNSYILNLKPGNGPELPIYKEVKILQDNLEEEKLYSNMLKKNIDLSKNLKILKEELDSKKKLAD